MSSISRKIIIPTVKLLSGQNFPIVGLGTYKSNNDSDKLKEAIKASISYGYTHFDCALCYENEDVVGKALHEAIEESNGSLKREDLFVVTKLWNAYHSTEEVPKCLDIQLKSFGLDYVDLYLMHWPFGLQEKTGQMYPTNEKGELLLSDVHYIEAYQAMEKLLHEGKTKSIGVSNFNIQQLKDVLKHCSVKPVVNQVEIHPYFQNDELIDFCKQNGIVVTAYAPLGAPDRGWRENSDPVVLEDPTIIELAKKYNKTPAQICLRWLTQRDIAVIPKSLTPSRIFDNINIFDFEISDEDIQKIKKLEKGFRYYGWTELSHHQFYPFK